MRILIRKILTKIISKEMKQKLKKIEYKCKKNIISKQPILRKEDLRNIIVNKLSIKEGDHIFVHASMDMINTNMTPLDILNLFLEIIGKEGSISVPTFVKYPSKEWMLMNKEFNIYRTPSGMGAFSERVRRHKNGRRSLHPTKSVSIIGNIADCILNEHHLDIHQFSKKSPFYKLIDYNVKIIGFGAPMSYLSMVHTVEDVFPNEFPIQINEANILEKICINENKKIVKIKTLVHNLKVVANANPEKFVKKYMSKNDYTIYNCFLTSFFKVDGKKLFQTLEEKMKSGYTIYD